MVERGDAVDGGDEIAPAAALGSEHPPSLCGEAVEAAPALARFLDPGAANPAALLEPVEERVEGGDVELQRAARARLDQLADLVAVPRASVGQRQDQELRAPFLELAVERRHI